MESTAIQPIFERDGYIALTVFFNAHKVGEIRREVDRFVSSQLQNVPPEQVVYEDPSRPETLSQIQHMHRHSDYFQSLLNDLTLTRVAETVLRGPVAGANVLYYNKPPGANSKTPPHQDGAYVPLAPESTVELWLSLDDADEDTGCLHYVRGSHVSGLLPHQKTDVPGFPHALVDTSPCDDPRTLFAARTRSGELLVHNALTIHWANENTSNHRQRRALGFIYFSQKALAAAQQEGGQAPQGTPGAPSEPGIDIGNAGAT